MGSRARSAANRPHRPTAVEEAERAGFDMSLIELSLSYTYEKRALQHQAALDLILELERAGRKPRERT